MRNHIKRILTSLVLLPLLIMIIYTDRLLPFNIFVIVCIFICLAEFFKLVEIAGMPCYKTAGMLLGIAICLIYTLKSPFLILFALTFSILLLFLKALTSSSPVAESIQSLCSTLLGLFYLPLMLGFIMLIRERRDGGHLIFFLLSIIWLDDIMAYYIGSWLGKHPLSPKISPKKTLEGTIGGLAGGIGAALFFKTLWLPSLSFFSSFMLGLIISCFGQLGDLSESLLKRWAGVKDSGAILPGHGGLLDRIDGLIFSTPVFYFLITLLMPGA